MDTDRLRGSGTSPRVKELLGELIADRTLIPSTGRSVPNLETLPNPLKSSMEKAERQGSAWCAWSLEGELFAIAGHIDDVGSRMHARPVLQVLLYDGKGRIIISSKWLEVQSNRWTFCES